MNKTQTVKELISQFNINLDLTSEVLNLKIEPNFDSYTIIQRILSFINPRGHIDYGTFDCYHFENDDAYCEIVPDCNLQTVIMCTRLKGSGRWTGVSFNSLGELSVRS